MQELKIPPDTTTQSVTSCEKYLNNIGFIAQKQVLPSILSPEHLILKTEIKFWRLVITKALFPETLSSMTTNSTWGAEQGEEVKNYYYPLLHSTAGLNSVHAAVESALQPQMLPRLHQPKPAQSSASSALPGSERGSRTSPCSFQPEGSCHGYSNRSAQTVLTLTHSNVTAELPKNEHDSIRKNVQELSCSIKP